MKEELTQEKSLEVITSMIHSAKGNVGSGAFHMIFWGWVVMLVSLSHFIFMKFSIIEYPEIVWTLMIPALLVSLYVGYKRGRSAKVTSYIDRIYMWIWLSFVITMALLLFFINGHWDLINPIVLTLAGYATFLSGKLIRFKPMVYGAICFWIWALIGYFAGPVYGLLVTSAAILTGYLIPGILLQRKFNES